MPDPGKRPECDPQTCTSCYTAPHALSWGLSAFRGTSRSAAPSGSKWGVGLDKSGRSRPEVGRQNSAHAGAVRARFGRISGGGEFWPTSLQSWPQSNTCRFWADPVELGLHRNRSKSAVSGPILVEAGGVCRKFGPGLVESGRTPLNSHRLWSNAAEVGPTRGSSGPEFDGTLPELVQIGVGFRQDQRVRQNWARIWETSTCNPGMCASFAPEPCLDQHRVPSGGRESPILWRRWQLGLSMFGGGSSRAGRWVAQAGHSVGCRLWGLSSMARPKFHGPDVRLKSGAQGPDLVIPSPSLAAEAMLEVPARCTHPREHRVGSSRIAFAAQAGTRHAPGRKGGVRVAARSTESSPEHGVGTLKGHTLASNAGLASSQARSRLTEIRAGQPTHPAQSYSPAPRWLRWGHLGPDPQTHSSSCANGAHALRAGGSRARASPCPGPQGGTWSRGGRRR